jgi:heptaprenylglyceryl phosphate synthase
MATDAAEAGADIVVVGNAIEETPSLINEISDAIHSLNKN